MTHIEVSLHLVNRQLRRAGYREAFDHEEEYIKIMASQGYGVDWITGQVKADRQLELVGI